MSDILGTLLSSANTLNAYTKVLQVTQNNVANASTPGFARQNLPLEAQQMDLESGTTGGVTAGRVESARNEFAEQAVRTQNTGLGWQNQAVMGLSSLQSVFDVSGNTGIDKALNDFFQRASAWGQTPSDQTARQGVIDGAAEVAQSFQNAATNIQNLLQQNDVQFRNTVDQVNQIVGQIQAYNHMALETGTAAQDSGVDAQVHAALENLSQFVDFTASKQSDGTTAILINGSTPLLIGDRQYALHAALTSAGADATYPNAPGAEQLLDGGGMDITAQSTGGQLGAILDMRNRVLASYMGDSNQAGSLNIMAQQFADRVNQLLTSGTTSDGPPPVAGVPLFTYDSTNATNIAKTLAVDPAVTPDQLAATNPGPPYVSNGVPLAISQLANPQNAADEIDGFSYTQYYGNLASNVGSQLQNAQNNVAVQQSLLAQAQNQRQQLSGVDLNEEAMMLVEFQRAYQANARFITVLDQLTQDTINILQEATMISNLSPQSQSFLASLDRVQQSVAQANQQVSSGLRVSVASDAPDVISQLLQLRANLQKNSQITANLGSAKTDADVAEGALSSASQLMDRALTLASQGASGTMTANDRQNLAGEVQAVEEQMLGYSQTQSGGLYVFSGDRAAQPTYQLDLSNANVPPNGTLTGTGFGVDRLIAPSNTRLLEDPAGGTFSVSKTAQQIFDTRNANGTPAADNVFRAIDGLRTALLNNDQAAIAAATTSIRTASDHVNQCLAFYGTAQNRIQAATTFAANTDIQLKTQISQIEDADVAAASLELSEGTTHIQAAFQMEAHIPHSTLFDFLGQ